MTDEMDRDPARDPALASALRELGPEPPMDQVDWDRLERRISDRARERFGREPIAGRSRAPWWQPMAVWARPAIPLGLAAGIALFVVLVRSPAEDAAAAVNLLAADPLAQAVYQGESAILLETSLAEEAGP
jgi:hypothetical protein